MWKCPNVVEDLYPTWSKFGYIVDFFISVFVVFKVKYIYKLVQIKQMFYIANQILIGTYSILLYVLLNMFDSLFFSFDTLALFFDYLHENGISNNS